MTAKLGTYHYLVKDGKVTECTEMKAIDADESAGIGVEVICNEDGSWTIEPLQWFSGQSFFKITTEGFELATHLKILEKTVGLYEEAYNN